MTAAIEDRARNRVSAQLVKQRPRLSAWTEKIQQLGPSQRQTRVFLAYFLTLVAHSDEATLL